MVAERTYDEQQAPPLGAFGLHVKPLLLPFFTMPQVLSGVSFGTPGNATVSMGPTTSETLEVGPDGSCVGKAAVRLRLDKPSRRAGARCNECIVLERAMRNAIV
jgi:hypothetical protein